MEILKEVEELRKQLEEEEQTRVRVALFGQPGSGKSSLINRLLGKQVAQVGVETDVTRGAEEYEWNNLILTDLPGYGTQRFPEKTYFQRFNVPEFDLFLCVFSGKFHEADSRFFSELKRIGKVCLFVRNKKDEMWQEGRPSADLEKDVRDDAGEHVGIGNIVYFISCRTAEGLEALQAGILDNLEGAKAERWARGAKAYSQEFLDKKKEAAEGAVTYHALVAAANATNPVPGVDIAVDFGVLLTLFRKLRECYGLSPEKLKEWGRRLPKVEVVANRILKFAVKEGLPVLLKRYAGKEAAKRFGKYIPVFGQLVAAGLGYAITSNAGAAYLNDCHEVASAILAEELSGQHVK